MRSLCVVGIVPLLAALGCGPTVNVLPLDATPDTAYDSTSPVRFYVNGAPRCPYREVGVLRADNANSELWSESTARAIRQRARKIGGDAVVGLHEVVMIGETVLTHSRHRESVPDSTPDGVVIRTTAADTIASSTPRQRYLAGTVVRFLQANCRE